MATPKLSVLIPRPAELNWDEYAVSYDASTPSAQQALASEAIDAHGIPSIAPDTISASDGIRLYGQAHALYAHYADSIKAPRNAPTTTPAGTALRQRVVPQILHDLVNIMVDLGNLGIPPPTGVSLPPPASKDVNTLGSGRTNADPKSTSTAPQPHHATRPNPDPSSQPTDNKPSTTSSPLPKQESNDDAGTLGAVGAAVGGAVSGLAAGVGGSALSSLPAMGGSAATSTQSLLSGSSASSGGMEMRHFGHPDVSTPPMGSQTTSLASGESSMNSSVAGSIGAPSNATSTTSLASGVSDTSSAYSLRGATSGTLASKVGEHALPTLGLAGLGGMLIADIHENTKPQPGYVSTLDLLAQAEAEGAAKAARSSHDTGRAGASASPPTSAGLPVQKPHTGPAPASAPNTSPNPTTPAAVPPSEAAADIGVSRLTADAAGGELSPSERLTLKRRKPPGTSEKPDKKLASSTTIAKFGDNTVNNPDTAASLLVESDDLPSNIGNYFSKYAQQISNNMRGRGVNLVAAARAYNVSTTWYKRDQFGGVEPGGTPSFEAINWTANHVNDADMQGDYTVEFAAGRITGVVDPSSVVSGDNADYRKVQSLTTTLYPFANPLREKNLLFDLPTRVHISDNIAMYAKLFWYAHIADFMADVGAANLPALTYPNAHVGTLLEWTDRTAPDDVDATAYLSSVARGSIQMIQGLDYQRDDIDIVALLASSGAAWNPAAQGAMLWQTRLKWPAIPVHVLGIGPAPAAGAAAGAYAIPAPAAIASERLHNFALKLARTRGELADCHRGLYWATEQFGMRFYGGDNPPAPDPNQPAPGNRQWYYAGPLQTQSAPRLHQPNDVSIAARMLRLVANDSLSFAPEVETFVLQSRAVRTRLIALYAGALQAFNNLAMIDFSIHQVDMLNYLTAGVAAPADLQFLLENLCGLPSSATQTEFAWLPAARGGFPTYMGCNAVDGIFPGLVVNVADSLEGDSLLAYTAVNPNHQVWGNKNFWGLDGWVSVRPVEWAIPTAGVTINLEKEIMLQGPDVACGWRSYLGTSAYDDAASNPNDGGYCRYIPYGMFVVNIIAQHRRAAANRLYVSRSDVQDVTTYIRWPAPVEYANMLWDGNASLFRSGYHVTYSWTNNVVSAPSFTIGNLDLGLLDHMKTSWHTNPPNRVGIVKPQFTLVTPLAPRAVNMLRGLKKFGIKSASDASASPAASDPK